MVRVDGSGSSNSLIKARGLSKTYSRGGEQIQVLQALNLDVDAVLFGPLAKNAGLRHVVIRIPANVHGPADSEGRLLGKRRRMHKNGAQARHPRR